LQNRSQIQALNSSYSGLGSLTLLRCAIAQTSAITFSSDAFTVMRTNGELSDSLRSIQSLRVTSRIIVETMPWDPFAGWKYERKCKRRAQCALNKQSRLLK